jgi:hypothetical protein
MAGNINSRLRQVKKEVEKQLPEQPVACYVNWTQPGEPEPAPEEIEVTFRYGGELVRCTLAEFRRRFSEGVELEMVRVVEWTEELENG